MDVNSDKGYVVIITGCSEGGIGAALCRAFHSAGCRVFATARRLDSMAGLRLAGIRTLALDVTSAESARAAVEAVLAGAGRVDILVNNAGIGLVAPLAEVDMDRAREVFDTNYWGTLTMVQAVAPHMIAQRAGTIVNVGSVVGYVSTPWGAIYCSSKAAVHSLTEALRLELRPFGVRVVLLAPGAVRSNLGANNLARFENPATAPGSLYAPFADAIRERATLSQQDRTSMPNDVFAAEVVQRVLRPAPPTHILLGGFVAIMRFALWWPQWLRDRFLARLFKVDREVPRPGAGAAPAPGRQQGGEAAGDKKKE